MRTPLVPPVSPPLPVAPAPARRGLRWWTGWLIYGVRVGLVLGVFLAWGLAALPGTVATWNHARQLPPRPVATVLPAPDADSLIPLLAAAQACPPTLPVLALSDDPRAVYLGNYLLYPRRVEPVRAADPFGPEPVRAHAGGCVFTYGPSGGRLDPFRATLSEIACTRDGCLYRLAP